MRAQIEQHKPIGYSKKVKTEQYSHPCIDCQPFDIHLESRSSRIAQIAVLFQRGMLYTARGYCLRRSSRSCGKLYGVTIHDDATNKKEKGK